jgi:hypothetical protein
MRELTLEQARALALRAQGFAESRPARPTMRHVRATIGRLQLLQIDSVNVVVRAHYLPLFSRLGPYPRATLDDLAYRRRELFEYWGHEACLMPVELWPMLRWRMDAPIEGKGAWERYRLWVERSADLFERTYEDVRARGPIGVSDIADRGGRAGPWWGWADEKHALEHLFRIGRLTAAGRRNFERLYDLTERVIPRAALDAPVPSKEEAHRELLVRSARALGVATASDLADYFRLHKPSARAIVKEMKAAGTLEEVRVEGWRDTGYVVPGTGVPRAPFGARALLAPFDPLIFERARTERLFGFFYRIEIYVPKPKRVYGYYVLPFLLGDRLVARVDLKSDRNDGALLVQGLHLEPGTDRDEVLAELAPELAAMAGWLGLGRVTVVPSTALARHLRRELVSSY